MDNHPRTVYRSLHDGQRLPWDGIRETPTCLSPESLRMAAGSPIHESLLRSFHIVRQAKTMLERGDSAATVLDFITWAEARPCDA